MSGDGRVSRTSAVLAPVAMSPSTSMTTASMTTASISTATEANTTSISRYTLIGNSQPNSHDMAAALPALTTSQSKVMDTTPSMSSSTSASSTDHAAATSMAVLAAYRQQPWIDLHETVYPLVRVSAVSIAASCAAGSGVLFGYPFDSVKTRMQAFKYPSTMACIRKTYAEEGLIGFYRGVIPVAITVSLLRSMSFSIYFRAKDELLNLIATEKSTEPNPISHLWAASFISGGLTGVFMASLSAPMELVKVQKQLERITSLTPPPISASTSAAIGSSISARTSVLPSSPLSLPPPLETRKPSKKTGKTTLQWFKYIIQTKGLRGLGVGYHLQTGRDGVGTAFYFSIYETFKAIATPTGEKPGPLIHMIGGGIAGTLSWIVAFPIDVVKSVIQQDAFTAKPKYRGAWEFVRLRFAQQGLAGFYQGIGPQLIRSFPIHSINFLVYENMLQLCRNLGLDMYRSDSDLRLMDVGVSVGVSSN
ncbi:hypothetical protein BASA50_004982 [Batrachochytrium salamandrivorans]|uniref:Mitochondrial carrier n=1 Tax=Batrachochytrium salamandrivorans TaxID=1357716 RepID=A0ABQ8FE47_9FUNG|nr:hypothetical protein BASA62_000122 [Batrachochytrium salamandrivorans]KAH6579593.1 hypothetical protein BASA60_003249 [Batrachochytrium salamandrivorans]KAH6594859.1 hypothetical protein BASA61_003949 [Batrachochytrium salamandrivorans]KAH6596651.1 hypothetical protein BASA50_004982 [Batrachochytrium salamandrivorans]KAH9270448.1 hypothetical protein BASA83_007448 [Batrachochytrium salamandrivorans]